MKRTVIIGFIILFFSSNVFSQNSGTQFSPEERARIQTGWMKENLQLNEQQLTKIDSLNLKYALKMEKVKSIQGRLNQIKEARTLTEEKDEQLKQVMNEKQFETYLEKRKELRKKMSEMRKEQ